MAPWATSLAAAALTPGLGKCPPCCPLARPPRPPRLPPALPPLSHLGHPPSPRPHCRFSLSCTSLPFAQRRGGLSAASRRAPSPGACPSASSPAVPCAPGRPETSLSQMSSRAVTRSGKFLCKKQHCSQPVTVQSLGEALCAQRQTCPLVRNCVGTWPGDRGSSPVTLIKSRQSAQGAASRGSAPARQGPPFPVQPSTPGCAFCCPSLSWEKTHRTNPLSVHFSIGLFFTIVLIDFLIHFWILTTYQIYDWQYFLLFRRLPFHFDDSFLFYAGAF